VDCWEYAYLYGTSVPEWKENGEWSRSSPIGYGERILESRMLWLWTFHGAEGREEWSVEVWSDEDPHDRDASTVAILNRAGAAGWIASQQPYKPDWVGFFLRRTVRTSG
jgi:hypothetical protein